MVFAILLISKQFIVVPNDWVKNKKLCEITTIFSSPDKHAVPDFTLDEKYLFDGSKANVYAGFIMKQFGNFRNIS